MKHSPKSGSILIYALVLVAISLTMATVILSNSVTLGLNHDYVSIKSKLARVISDDSRVVFKLARQLNSNGGGFIDDISCPQNITMSGSTSSGTILSELYADEFSVYCSGTYLTEPLKIYMNTGSTDFPLTEYSGSIITLIDSLPGKKGGTAFGDSDNTIIDFSSHNYKSSDDFDDNANSDNYQISSTGSTLYNYDFYDDDALHRLIKFGYVSPGTGFNSIFWTNDKTNAYIDKNGNNDDSINTKVGLTNSGSLYVTVDKESTMYLYKLNKEAYTRFNELQIEQKLEGSLIAGEGYIQDNGSSISLSGSTDVLLRNDYIFDFTLNDYVLLLQNSTEEVLSYNIKGFDSVTGSGLYIVAIDDSEEDILKYLGNSIVIDEEKRLISEQIEVVGPK